MISFRFFFITILIGFKTSCFGQGFGNSFLSSNIYKNLQVGLLAFSDNRPMISLDSIFFLHEPIHAKKSFLESNDVYFTLFGKEEFNLDLSHCTQVKYQLASKTSQRLQLRHYQMMNLNSNLDLIADFGSTKGYYPFQEGKFKIFRPNIQKGFFKDVYTIRIGYESFSFKLAENGGLKDANSFVFNQTSDERTVPVKMNNSFSEANSNSFLITQQIKIPDELTDSSIPTDRFIWKNLIKYHRLKRKFFTDRVYSELFSNAFLDTNSTKDSVMINEIVNQSTMEYDLKKILNYDSDIRKIYFKFDANFQLAEVRLNGKQTPLFRGIQFYPGFSLRAKKFNSLIYFIAAFYNRLDNSFGAGAEGEIKSGSSRFSFSLSSRDSCPPFFYFHTFSNHFIWERDYRSIRNYAAQLGYQKFWNQLQISATINFDYYKNHHFLNALSEPEVYSSTISLTKSIIRIQYNINKWRFNSESRFQSTNRKELIRQPGIVQFLQVLIGDSVFRSKALLQAGPSVNYVSSYFLPSFNPALQEFYYGKMIKLKGYYQVNFYTQLTINRAEIYFVLEHMNAGWGNRNYFYAVDYPLPGRMIKLGIKWLLEN
ncbi:MAG: hypothetical protein JNL47_02235 [Bacteroidia bacterium]|nr:hypothetical protein [Bacteroidia bacterium]